MKFSIVNLGCKVNRVESDDAAVRLLAMGGEEAPLGEADLVVVNTCAVTGEAEKKTRKTVRHALRDNDHAAVVVTGCAAALSPSTYTDMSDRVLFVPKARLAGELARLACSCTDGDEVFSEADFHGSLVDERRLRVGGAFPTRVGVKVQDGCNNACTYCIVHVARGKACSRPVSDVVEECVSYARAGVKEIVLTGINLGSYHDASAEGEPVGLASLLLRLLEATDEFRDDSGLACRFRVSSIEPKDIDDAFIEVLAASQGRICRHLHLPLQSGSSKVLCEMDRPYDAAFFVDLVERLRSRVPALALSTDVIVGFPGETEDDFRNTCDVAERCGFSKIHVFPYSKREGTPAALRSDQIPPSVAAERAARLRALAKTLRERDYRRRAGTVEHVVVEQCGRAMSESYYEVAVSPEYAVGSLVPLALPASRACVLQ